MNKYAKKIKEYLAGPFLLPWIWVFALLVVNITLVLISQTKETVDISKKIASINNEHFSVATVLNLNIVFVVFNYTVSFFVKAKHIRLQTILFVVSLLYTVSSIVIYWPNFLEVFVS